MGGGKLGEILGKAKRMRREKILGGKINLLMRCVTNDSSNSKRHVHPQLLPRVQWSTPQIATSSA